VEVINAGRTTIDFIVFQSLEQHEKNRTDEYRKFSTLKRAGKNSHQI